MKHKKKILKQNNSKMHLVSVIIPYFNAEDYIEKCIKSVIRQTYKKIEIIIIDDGSNEKAKKKILDLKKLYPSKIKIITHKKNLGVSFARNSGIKYANGEYIAFLDSDDIWLHYKLEHQINILKKKKIDFLHSSYYSIDQTNIYKGLFLAKNLDRKQIEKSCDIGLSTVIIKSSIAKKILFKNIKTKEDYIYWLDLLNIYNELKGDKRVVTIYRERKNSLSRKSNILKFQNAYLVYKKFLLKNSFLSILLVLRLSLFYLIKKFNSYKNNFFPIWIKILVNHSKLKFNNSFILVAFNLATMSFINRLFIVNSKIIFWADGAMVKLLNSDLKKIPGRNLIYNFKPPSNIKTIYLCGIKSINQKKFLKKKIRKGVRIIFKVLPFFKDYEQILNYNLSFSNNSIIILNISSPKQEIIAEKILNENPNKKLFIYCIGAALAMVSGEEKITPKFLDYMNLEWLWRLRTNIYFRSKRLIVSFVIFLFRYIIGYFNRLYFKIL